MTTSSDDSREVGERLARIEETLTKVGSSIKGLRSAEKRGIERFERVFGRLARIQQTLARIDIAFDASTDARFIEVAKPLVESRRTMLEYDRLFTLWESARNVAAIEGAAVEIGTFRGGSAALMAQALQAFAGAPREVHVVDTFEGHLDTTFSEHDDEVQRGKFQQTQFDDVRAFLAEFPATHVHMGNGPVVAAGWPERLYCLVHLDVDLYQPTLDCLRYFGPRLATGGILIVDDYEAPACPGIGVAVREYLAADTGFQTWRLRAEQIVLVKR